MVFLGSEDIVSAASCVGFRVSAASSFCFFLGGSAESEMFLSTIDSKGVLARYEVVSRPTELW